VAAPSTAGRTALREAIIDQLSNRRFEPDSELAERLQETREACGETREVTDSNARRVLLDVRLDIERYVETAEGELPLVPMRLLGSETDREVYGEFDRLRAEAEFRAAIALPLAAIIAVVAWRTAPWTLVALVVPVLLFVDAMQTAAEASDALAEAVRSRELALPVFDQVCHEPLWERDPAGRLRRAAEVLYPKAMVQRAEQLAAGGDAAAAEEWFRKAAVKGDASAMFRLAGWLHRRDDPEAETWYAEAADAGHEQAGEIRDLARRWSATEIADLKSAYAGDGAAMTRVGQRCEGRGDIDQAERWYRRGDDAGHRPASEALAASLRRRGLGPAAKTYEREAP
jgi:hypothetical protein